MISDFERSISDFFLARVYRVKESILFAKHSVNSFNSINSSSDITPHNSIIKNKYKQFNVNLSPGGSALGLKRFGIRHKILHLPVNLALLGAMAQLLNPVES